VDSALFATDVPVIVQGITGRVGSLHARLMRDYGTRIVGGVSNRSTEPVGDIPVFASCAEAVRATGARASLVMTAPMGVRDAALEAIAAGIGLLVCVAEGVPVHDSLRFVRAAREAGAVVVGPSTPGIAVPGRMKIGFLPDVALAPGPLGVMSKSGTLSYEIGYRLAQRGVGQSLWIGVGGDAVKGTRFADLVPVFEADAATKGMLVIGEIGGTEEEELADALIRQRARKPVFALIAGASAPQGVMMGHAGALVEGGRGTARSKTAALEHAGVHVFATMRDLVERVPALLAATAEP
jgi:succinyl-CoA synthetase alpha subunit